MDDVLSLHCRLASERATSPSQPATLTGADVAASHWPAWLARLTVRPIGCQDLPLLSKQLSHPDGYVGLIQRVCVTFNPVRQVTSFAIPASFSCTFHTNTHLSFISRQLDLTSSSARAAGVALKHELLSPRHLCLDSAVTWGTEREKKPSPPWPSV